MLEWCCCLGAILAVVGDGSEATRGVPVGTAARGVSERATNEPPAPRGMHEIHRDLREALQLEATAKEAPQWAAAVARLVLIYGEIMRDPRLADSPTLSGYRVKTRARLLRIQKDLQRELARQGRGARQNQAAQAALGQEPWTMSLALGSESAEQLATRLKEEAARWNGAPGGAARGDYGELLVELIRQTIAPEFWNVNGGPGVIVYYRPGLALVVRATEDIHRQIGGAVGGFRK